MGEAARGAGRDIPKIGSGSRRDRQMLRDEGVGKGTNFQPSAHRGASSREKHEMATGLADKVNARQNMSPKEWMELIHHMGQTKDGSRFLHVSDIDMNHKDWNKPISFGDMRQHLDRMNVNHGTHGDGGRRGFDNIKNKLEDVVSGHDTGGLKLNPIPESEAPEPNWQQRKPREPRRQRRGRQRRPTNFVMNSIDSDYQSTNSITDIFKRAFNMPTSKGA
jgi:hypothetical protein